jgi:hypothetical protein
MPKNQQPPVTCLQNQRQPVVEEDPSPEAVGVETQEEEAAEALVGVDLAEVGLEEGTKLHPQPNPS